MGVAVLAGEVWHSKAALTFLLRSASSQKTYPKVRYCLVAITWLKDMPYLHT